MFLISFPILVIWVFGLPIAAFVLLLKYRDLPDTSKIKQYFLILYQGLKPERFYWEFINTLRKVLILSSYVLSSDLKILFSLTILIISGRLQTSLKPFKKDENNNCELLAITAGTITTLSGLVYSQDESVSHLNLAFMIIIVVINSLFLLDWVYLMSKNLESKITSFKKVSSTNLSNFSKRVL